MKHGTTVKGVLPDLRDAVGNNNRHNILARKCAVSMRSLNLCDGKPVIYGGNDNRTLLADTCDGIGAVFKRKDKTCRVLGTSVRFPSGIKREIGCHMIRIKIPCNRSFGIPVPAEKMKALFSRHHSPFDRIALIHLL